jgi:hypothetical protein
MSFLGPPTKPDGPAFQTVDLMSGLPGASSLKPNCSLAPLQCHTRTPSRFHPILSPALPVSKSPDCHAAGPAPSPGSVPPAPRPQRASMLPVLRPHGACVPQKPTPLSSLRAAGHVPPTGLHSASPAPRLSRDALCTKGG